MARPRAPIVAPGVRDSGAHAPDPRTIGHHERSLRFVQGDPSVSEPRRNRDAAAFRLKTPGRMSSWQGEHYDTPADVADPLEDGTVEKVGRTTGLTRGLIESELVGPYPVIYKSLTHHSSEESDEFRGTVYFEPVFLIRAAEGLFSAPGDSGALVTQVNDAGKRSSVGLIFSGGPGTESYMLPLKPILNDLDMTVVSGHNEPDPR